jgi:hypothetical protein
MGTRIYWAFSIDFTSLLGDGVAASQSAGEAAEVDDRENPRERSGGEEGDERDKADSLVS